MLFAGRVPFYISRLCIRHVCLREQGNLTMCVMHACYIIQQISIKRLHGQMKYSIKIQKKIQGPACSRASLHAHCIGIAISRSQCTCCPGTRGGLTVAMHLAPDGAQALHCPDSVLIHTALISEVRHIAFPHQHQSHLCGVHHHNTSYLSLQARSKANLLADAP